MVVCGATVVGYSGWLEFIEGPHTSLPQVTAQDRGCSLSTIPTGDLVSAIRSPDVTHELTTGHVCQREDARHTKPMHTLPQSQTHRMTPPSQRSPGCESKGIRRQAEGAGGKSGGEGMSGTEMQMQRRLRDQRCNGDRQLTDGIDVWRSW